MLPVLCYPLPKKQNGLFGQEAGSDKDIHFLWLKNLWVSYSL